MQQVVAQLPWGHNVRILEMVKAPAQREWYIRQAVESGWTRNVLVHQIEGDLHRRQGRAVTNFQRTLPAPQSELAQELLKDPYNFDFLTLGTEMLERDLERGLIDHLRDLILELGWPASARSTNSAESIIGATRYGRSNVPESRKGPCCGRAAIRCGTILKP